MLKLLIAIIFGHVILLLLIQLQGRTALLLIDYKLRDIFADTFWVKSICVCLSAADRKYIAKHAVRGYRFYLHVGYADELKKRCQ